MLKRFLLRSQVGSLGEELSCRYLKGKGYRIRETNYCNSIGRRVGEIDIVAEKDGKLFFVEVKTRTKEAEEALLPETSINREKLRKLERAARAYIREKGLLNVPYGFDALSILYDPAAKQARVRHLQAIYLSF